MTKLETTLERCRFLRFENKLMAGLTAISAVELLKPHST